ncbi:MAG: LPS export ABC transporter periplasmic protein LptC [Candidatus Riflebacteria bacterium]|nr:LPS export ABC transporter periplasmic protein LptC [Candidatus Riflebacteria bacterium]
MKSIFSNIWFWLAVLILFLAVIFRDSDLEKDAASKYIKGKMKLTDVHFSEMDKGVESARVFADEVEMDDMQTNMVATHVHALFFDKQNASGTTEQVATGTAEQVATKTADLTASSATKNPYEIRFFGDARLRTSENERLRADELRYLISRKEIYTSCPVTIWKDDMVLTGKELRFNTENREGDLKRDILIRIWKKASETASVKSHRHEITKVASVSESNLEEATSTADTPRSTSSSPFAPADLAGTASGGNRQ